MPSRFVCFALAFTLWACTPAKDSTDFNKEAVIIEVTQMFDNYHRDIQEKGLTAEFDYLYPSDDFFWVPPGYTSALTYDSVKTILEMNAKHFRKVEFHFDTLKIFPITNEMANYSGIVSGTMEDTSMLKTKVAIIESGTIIKRKDGWKLLCGQSANIPNE